MANNIANRERARAANLARRTLASTSKQARMDVRNAEARGLKGAKMAGKGIVSFAKTKTAQTLAKQPAKVAAALVMKK